LKLYFEKKADILQLMSYLARTHTHTHIHTHTSRGGTKFCGAWSLYNVWGSLEGKEYKITNTKLVTKVNIYLE